MKPLEPGDTAPELGAPDENGATRTLKDFKGQNLILYFYPKDDTPGCTKEACGFNEALNAFKKLGTAIVGVSKDSTAKHEKFKAKYGLEFTLLSDESGDLCERYGVWAEKSMYGKKYMGIERSTFLIDAQGKIVQIWRNVKVPGHVEDVQAALRSLAKAA